MFRLLKKKYITVVAIGLNLCFASILIFLHLINSEYGVLQNPVSIYYYTRYGPLLSIGLIMIGIVEILTGLVQDIIGSRFLFILLGISAILTGYFPMDVEPNISACGLIHVYAAAFQFGFFPVSVLLFLSKSDNNTFHTFSRIVAYILFLIFLIIIFTVVSKHTGLLNMYGLSQKIYIFLIVLWLLFYWIQYAKMKK
jgi:hypothetical protein